MPKLSEVSGQKPGKLKLSQVKGQSAPKAPSTGDRIKRELGLSARSVVEGAGDLIGLFADPLIHAYNWLGEKEPTTASLITGKPERRWGEQATMRAGWGQALDQIGVPRPETASERVYGDAGRALTGTALTLGVGAAAGQGSRLGRFLTASPGVQAAAATTGSSAAGGAREAGLPVGVQIGAGLVGGIAPAAGASLGSVATGAARQTARTAISPFTSRGADQAAGSIIRGAALDPRNLERVSPSAIPGSVRTLAEETLDPGIAQLQRTVAGRRGAEFDQIRRTSNAARSKALEGIAGDDVAMDAAEKARATAANPLRREAMIGGKVDTTRLVGQLDRLIKGQKGNESVQSGVRKIRDLLTSDQPIPVREADNIRKTIGYMLGGKYGGDSAQALAGSRELMAVKNQLDRVLAKQAPKYGEYIEAYKQGSKPINRMQLGQTLLDSGTGKTRDGVTGAYQILPGSFGGQVKNLDRAAASATGFKKATAANILSPDDFATIRAVDDDLSRQVFADTAARGSGSDTFQKLMTQGDILGAVQELGYSVPGASVLRLLGDAGMARVNARLAEALANPAEARRILEVAPPVERRIMEEALNRLQGGTGTIPVLAGQDD